jgi:FkbM family methyltransferase
VSASPSELSTGARLRHRIAVGAVRQGGWPLPPRFVDRLRDVALAAMGIGSASFDLDKSGEGRLLDLLSSRWAEHDRVTVLDVGGHAGAYARAARSAFGSRAEIHCFEPNPALYASLRELLSSDPGIRCHEVALGSAPGAAQLFLDREGSARGSLVPGTFEVAGQRIESTHTVEVSTLDRVAHDLQLDRVDLLKIDVEGHELAVLEGAEELLAAGRVEAVQFEFGERNLASRTYLRDFFELLGPRFRFHRVTPRGLVPLEYRPKIEVFALATNYLALGPSPR